MVRGGGRGAFGRLLALASAVIAQLGPALGDEPLDIGHTIFVVADVEGRLGDAPPKRIVLNDNVVYEEDITTGDEAKTIVEFRDGSTFEVGPSSVVRIDSFVFNPDEGISRKVMSVGRGVFRYVSGYAAPQRDTQVSTPTGTLTIRGSVAAGMVDPDVPTFLYVGEGSAVFTNDAGSADMQQGSALAVPSRTTAVMRPAAMPPAVVAQALQAIERRLPPSEVLRHRPPADDAWLRRAGGANLLPIAEQARREAAVVRGHALAVPAGPSRLAREVNLLIEGNRHNLFDGAHPNRTPEQHAFIGEMARSVPQARTVLARYTAQAGALHRLAALEGTHAVIRGIATAAPSAEVLTRVTAAAVSANPAAASQITHSAVAAYRGPDLSRVAAQLGNAAAGARSPQPRRPASTAAATERKSVRSAQPLLPAPGSTIGHTATPPRGNGQALIPRHGNPPVTAGSLGHVKAQADRAPRKEQASGRSPPPRPSLKKTPGDRSEDRAPR